MPNDDEAKPTANVSEERRCEATLDGSQA